MCHQLYNLLKWFCLCSWSTIIVSEDSWKINFKFYNFLLRKSQELYRKININNIKNMLWINIHQTGRLQPHLIDQIFIVFVLLSVRCKELAKPINCVKTQGTQCKVATPPRRWQPVLIWLTRGFNPACLPLDQLGGFTLSIFKQISDYNNMLCFLWHFKPVLF